jgi:hypothetical protein
VTEAPDSITLIDGARQIVARQSLLCNAEKRDALFRCSHQRSGIRAALIKELAQRLQLLVTHIVRDLTLEALLRRCDEQCD